MLKKPSLLLGLKTGQPMLDINRNTQPDYRGIPPLPPMFFQQGGIIDNLTDRGQNVRKGNYFQRRM